MPMSGLLSNEESEVQGRGNLRSPVLGWEHALCFPI